MFDCRDRPRRLSHFTVARDFENSVCRIWSLCLIHPVECSRDHDRTSRLPLMSIVRVRRPAIVKIVGEARADERRGMEKAPLRYGRGFATVSAFIKREEIPARARWGGAIENRLTRTMASLCHYFEQRETLREEESGDLLRFALQAPRRMYTAVESLGVSRSCEQAK